MAFKCSGNGYTKMGCENEPIWLRIGVSLISMHCNDCKEHLDKSLHLIFIELDNACESCFNFSYMKCLKFNKQMGCLIPSKSNCFKHKKVFERKFALKPVAKIFPENVKKFEEKICVECDNPIGFFEKDICRLEYAISGLCQDCQNKVFKSFKINCPFCEGKSVSDVINCKEHVDGQWECENGHQFLVTYIRTMEVN